MYEDTGASYVNPEKRYGVPVDAVPRMLPTVMATCLEMPNPLGLAHLMAVAEAH